MSASYSAGEDLPVCEVCQEKPGSLFRHAHGVESTLCAEHRRKAIAYEAAEGYMEQLLDRALREWMEVYGDNPAYACFAEEAAFIARRTMDELFAEQQGKVVTREAA